MTNEVMLFMEDQVYEVQTIYAGLYNGRLSVTGRTSEKMGEAYGLCYELNQQDTRKLEEFLEVEEKELLAEIKKRFSGEGADEEFRDFCKLLGLNCKCFLS